ncbi:MAG: lasso peptide biosynthesis B2 protein [Hyphomicrobium sp.]|nr:lasso peptide biosynthesis B2 protein [Hyphomicrobium sp.]
MSLGDWWLLFIATLHLARAAVHLRTRAVSEVCALASPRLGKPGIPTQKPASATRIGWAIGAAAKVVPWKANCLAQAVAASHLLQRSGCESEIRIGVRRDGQELLAHAWVVCDGEIVVGASAHDEFMPLRATAEGQIAALQTNMPSWI